VKKSFGEKVWYSLTDGYSALVYGDDPLFVKVVLLILAVPALMTLLQVFIGTSLIAIGASWFGGAYVFTLLTRHYFKEGEKVNWTKLVKDNVDWAKVKKVVRSSSWSKEIKRINNDIQKIPYYKGNHSLLWATVFMITIATVVGLFYTSLAMMVPPIRDHGLWVFLGFFITSPLTMRLSRRFTPFLVAVVEDAVRTMVMEDGELESATNPKYALSLKGKDRLILERGASYEDGGFLAMDTTTGKDLSGKVIRSSKQLNHFDWNSLPKSFVIKPNRGSGGKGIFIFFGKVRVIYSYLTW